MYPPRQNTPEHSPPAATRRPVRRSLARHLCLTLLLASFASLTFAAPALAAEPNIPFFHNGDAIYASGLTATCATFHAYIELNGPGTDDFEYVTQAQFNAHEFEAAQKTSESAHEGEVVAEACALKPNTTYHFRPVATNAESPPGGTIGPAGPPFTTLPNGPSHLLAFSFGSKTSTVPDPFPLSDPTDLAENTTTHNLYVTDPGNNRVEEFGQKGEFLLVFGREVNETAVKEHRSEEEWDICPALGHPADKCTAGVSGSEPGEFEDPGYVAIDNSSGASKGDVYVANTGDDTVQKFTPSGQLVTTWGVGGQIDTFNHEGSVFPLPTVEGLAVDSNGQLYWLGGAPNVNLWIFSQSGSFLEPQLAPRGAQTDIFPTEAGVLTINRDYAYDPSDSELYIDSGSQLEHCLVHQLPHTPESHERNLSCEPLDAFGSLSASSGILVEPHTHALYAVNGGANDVVSFTDVRPQVTTGPPEEPEETALTLTGSVNPETDGVDHGPIVACRFEWGTSTAYGHTAPCEPNPETGSHFTTATAVKVKLTGLPPITSLPIGTTYHYRLVASNEKVAPSELGATAEGADETALTIAPPQIEGVSSSHLTATSAQLDATIKPNGLPTAYRFQYGTTTAYGQTSAEGRIEGTAKELSEPKKISISIAGLQSGVAYHFRLLAENELDQGSPELSEDHTFEFFPPACPNSAVRQQTGSAYLPDCRAYELVSPANANATLLYAGGPNTGQATSPSRFTYTGEYSSLPGTDTVETTGDLYVATRTDTGWVSKYIGLPGEGAGCMGGPPTDPNSGAVEANAALLTDTVLTDPSMSRFLDFLDGGPIECRGDEIFLESSYQLDPPSTAPYLFGSEGADLGRLPTDFAGVPGGEAAFLCPYQELNDSHGLCGGETTASPDLTHLFFSSNRMSFAEGGLTAAPGSAYDDNLTTGSVELVSKLADGSPIPQDPAFASAPPKVDGQGHVFVPGGAEEFLRFPAVSTDGSDVLISTATAGTENCGLSHGPYGSSGAFKFCPRFTETPVHLYMRVDDAITYKIAEDPTTHEPAPVNYVGMTPDGSRVYFTSEAHLTHEDESHTGASLFMWSAEAAEGGQPAITLISKAAPGSPAGAGDTGACNPAPVEQVEDHQRPIGEAPWTTGCGVLPVSTYSWSDLEHSRGGNGISDTAIASTSGDIYFYSPEQLDGDRGLPGQQNLYVYREGNPQYVTTLTPELRCSEQYELEGQEGVCSEGPIVRIDDSPDDSHMSFLTASRLTSYENAGHEELYSYTPATESLVCDSCNPSGHPATAEVEVAQDGLFMTDDGRTFFSTSESLVPADTNQATDVYEYVDGRPQLITPGTGTATATNSGSVARPGIIGVSANGTDVYFSTYDTLIPEDHNGNFLKFYDARTDGGFPQPPPNQPCAAAEECHGPGTEPPTLPTPGTTAEFTGGNVEPGSHSKHHKKHKKARAKHHRRVRHERSKKHRAKHHRKGSAHS